MSKKIVLIDGHSILNRAFYGIPDLTNYEGKHTNAVYGFLNILFSILEQEKPEYLAVAFDLPAPTFRHKMFEAYKGTRKPAPAEFREQVPLMKEVLTTMGIPLLMKEGFEADDLLGTIGKRCEKEGLEVTIVSGDRDLLQLATDHILIRIPKTRGGKTTIEDYHTKDVLEHYQVTPLQIIELKALMGDTSDNIPGIPGVGEKTATKLIVEYGSIENAYEHVEEIKPNKAKESLQNHYDMAVMSKKLATIDIDSPVDFSLDEAKITDFYNEQVYELFKRLEFKNLLGRFMTDAREDDLEETFSEIHDFAEADNFFTDLGHKKSEKKSNNDEGKASDNVDSLGIAWLLQDEFYGLAISKDKEHTVFIWAEGFISEDYLKDKLNSLIEKGYQLRMLDVKAFLKWVPSGRQDCFADVSLAAYLMNPLKSSYTYDDLAKEYLSMSMASREELIGKEKLPKAIVNQPDKCAKLACYEAYVCGQVIDTLLEKLEESQMMKLYTDMEMPLLFTLNDMENAGVKIDAESLKEYGDKLGIRIKELEQIIYNQAGEEFNINSPKQLGVILFEKMQLPGGKKTKTGYSTAADILEKLAPEYGIVTDILEYRQLTKLKSTYADGLANYIGSDGRIHSTFNQTITATGRISSTEPNLQNIPIRMELGRLIRKVFIPEEGYVFLDADYSQIELRVLAHLSGDEQLIEAYNQAQDIHRLTASQVFHIPFDEVTSLQRRNAKAVNFGIVYGISSFGLSQDLSITPKEASAYIKKYFETYPKIKEYLDGLVTAAKEEGFVTSMFHRRRPIPELSSSNFMQRSFGERVAMNSPIQGTAADIIKIAMIRVNQTLKSGGFKSRLLLQVHDELLIETKVEELEEVSAILKKEMEDAAHLAVALEVDMHSGPNWYEAK
ncbi:MAG: DNA polymerase I [Lachnospiraceae bacterium]|nr:DNA polymerase I [Lachnospiraceae bacterium]MDD3615013.1 DNA polymerase I [Lachnospiraceae bacterium]